MSVGFDLISDGVRNLGDKMGTSPVNANAWGELKAAFDNQQGSIENQTHAIEQQTQSLNTLPQISDSCGHFTDRNPYRKSADTGPTRTDKDYWLK